MATMIEADRMPVPLGTPAVSFSQIEPGGAAVMIGISTYLAKIGPKMKRPHMPKTIEGMPASSSTAVPIGRRRKVGQSSTRKNAAPKASGTAIAMASTATTMVPTIRPATPKTPATGSQSEVMKNDRPNLEKAGQPPITSEIRMPPSMARSMVAAAAHTYSNQGSSSAPFGAPLRAVVAAVAVIVALGGGG